MSNTGRNGPRTADRRLKPDSWRNHRQSEQCIRAELRRMLTEQLEAANKRLLQGPSPTEPT